MSDQHWTIDAASAGIRLDKFLADAVRLASRSRAAGALERGKVFVNTREVTTKDAARRLVAGDTVRVWADRPGSAKKKTLRAARHGELTIVYQDEALVVVNKPPGLLTVPLERQEDAASVQAELVLHLRSHGKRRPMVVHRIDRDTSGLVVFAVHAQAQRALKEQFRHREPERVYLAVVSGVPRPAAGEWRDRLVWSEAALMQRGARADDPRAVEAISRYRVVEAFGDAASLIEVWLETGKQNQIRVQAQLHGHPLVGERRYIRRHEPESVEDPRAVDPGRQALHAWRLAFDHPADGRELRFEAPVPKDITELLEELRPRAKV